MKMRILHIIDLANIGGVERIFSEFLNAPSPYPVEHFILSERNAIAQPIRDNVLEHARLVTVRDYGVFRVPKWPKSKWLRKARRRQCIKNIAPDLIVVWNQFTDVVFPTKCPVIYYEHGGSWYTHAQQFVQKFFAQIDAIIAVSHAAKRILQLKYHVQQPVHVRKNVLLDSAWPSMPIMSRHGLDGSQPVRLGSAGRLAPVKCMGLLILTAKVLKEKGCAVTVTIAGEGKERSVLENLIEQHGLQQEVRLLGLQNNLDDFYQNIDIYLCPSMHESFGLTNLEAAAWGIPTITGKADGMVESVQDGITGLCLEPTLDVDDYLQRTHATPEYSPLIYWPNTDTIAPPKMLDPETIADAVIALRDDPARYQKLSQQALTESRKQERFAMLALDLYRFFDEQVTRKRGARDTHNH
jgi:Glycosyltransferase